MKPVIFLDFDGVLNSIRSAAAFGGCGRHQFDPVAVGMVARLAGAADARVVISSVWRIGNTLDDLRGVLGDYSTTLAARVIGKTPTGGACRGHEIARWLAENPGEHDGRFVIIDDSADMLDSQLPRFVRTNLRDGFGLPEYLKALEILSPGHADLHPLSFGAYATIVDHVSPASLIQPIKPPLQWGADG